MSRISATNLSAIWAGDSDGSVWPEAGSKNRTWRFGRFGKRAMSGVPVIAQQTRRVSGTSSARRPTPLRARSSRPTEIVPSGKIPMHEPARRAAIALTSAPASPIARSIGIWPIPFRMRASTGLSHKLDLARARIWRRRIADMPITTGSICESWLPMISVGPLRGTCSSPSTVSRPHHAIGRQTAIAAR